MAAVAAQEATPGQLIDARLSDLRQVVFSMAQDLSARDEILDPGVGYLPGAGSLWQGVVDTGQGPSSPVVMAVMAATDGTVTAVVSVVADARVKQRAFQAADSVLNLFTSPLVRLFGLWGAWGAAPGSQSRRQRAARAERPRVPPRPPRRGARAFEPLAAMDNQETA